MRLAAIVLFGAATSCEALFGGFQSDNLENCEKNGQLCATPDEACNTVTKLCEPAIQLLSIDPPRASNVGGTTVTLTGHRLTADLTVLFNGVPGSNVASTPVQPPDSDQITVSVPASLGTKGLVSVELVHPAGQRQHRDDLFGYYGPIKFQETTSPGFSGPKNLFSADVDGDHHPDILLCDDGNTAQLYLLLGKGDGTLAAQKSFPLANAPTSCGYGDVNRDGKLDVVVNELNSKQFEVLLGDGAGNFAPQTPIPTVDFLNDIALADLNGDGAADVVAADGTAISIQLSDGAGGFGAPTNYAYHTGSGPPAITLADLNKDGAIDVLTANSSDLFIGILYGDGHGSFANPVTKVSQPRAPRRVFLADINSDGRQDLLAPSANTAQFIVSIQLADGSFDTPQFFPIPTNPNFLVLLDLNGDKLIDMAWLSSLSSKNFGSFVGLGDGRFVDGQTQTIQLVPSGIVATDLNGDGMPDLVIPELNSKLLHIFLNKSQ